MPPICKHGPYPVACNWKAGPGPHDPNAKYGPTGSVTPGQMMTYTLEYENSGEGTALGVYVKDTLDASLDDSTLRLRDHYLLDHTSATRQIVTTFPWTYDSHSRTVTVMAGDAQPHWGGSFVLEARLRADAAPGTIIPNQSFVYFPNALDPVTPTQTVVSAVPLPTQLASTGASSAVYLDTARLTAKLTTSANAAVAHQTVSFRLAGATMTATTDSSGQASVVTSVLDAVPGKYTLAVSYTGDNFYYLPSAANVDFTVAKRPTLLLAPYVVVEASAPARLTVTLTDNLGQPLARQSEEPKTVFLEMIGNGGAATPLGSSLLTGTTVSFQISAPLPLQASWTLRARFDGDSRYAASTTTGTMSLGGYVPADLYPPGEGGDIPPGVTLDALPPRTNLSASGLTFSSGSALYASTQAAFALSAVDDLTVAGDGVGSGVAATYLAVDTTTFSVYSGTFSLAAAATHAVSFYSADLVGNTEAAKTSTITIDGVPPVTALLVDSLPAGTTNLVLVSTSALGFSAADALSGVDRTFYSVDGGTFAVYASTFSLTVGTHSISYYSLDRVDNAEAAATVALNVLPPDSLPPRTSLSVGAPSFSSATLYAADVTTFGLVAIDDKLVIGDGVGLGMAQSFVALDTTTFSLYGGTFAFASEGPHSVSFYSVDVLGHAEAPQSASVSVDLTSPITTLQVQGSSAPAASEAIAISTAATISLSALDPLSDGVASGLGSIFYIVDADPFSSSCDGVPLDPTQPPGTCANEGYNGAFTLSTGTHVVYYLSEDNVGNQEAVHVATFAVHFVDALPPRTNLAIGSPKFGGSPVYVTTATPFSLSSVDDLQAVGDAAGLGVAQTLVSVDSGAFAVYGGTFALAASGPHAVSFYSVDTAGNVESPQTQSLFLDSTPPHTLLLIDNVPTSTATLVLISSDVVSFVSSDAGSGVSRTLYALDGSTVAPVAVSTFSLAVGTHSLVFQSVDNLGNAEPVQTALLTVLQVDVVPPSVALQPVDGSTATTATPALVASYSDLGRGVDAASVRLSLDGLDVTSSATVTASSTAFVPPAALSQATHTVVVQVADLAGNQSVSTSTFLVDSIAPVTTLQIDGLAASATSLVLISSDAVGLAAFDAGTGIAQILYALDGGSQTVFVSTFSLAVGTHTLAYFSADRAGNAETPKSALLTVNVLDTTPPVVTLTPPTGSTVTSASPSIIAVYSDAGRGVDPGSVLLSLDGVDVTTRALVTASSATFVSTATLSQGSHSASVQLADFAGNRSSATSAFFLDSIPPVTTLLVDGLSASSTSMVLVSTDALGLAASDAGTGIAQTLYALDGGNQTVFVSTFSLAVGTHSLAYFSIDRAGNAESPHPVFMTVKSTQVATAPPLVRLDFPSPRASGVEQALGGVVAVRGAVYDDRLQSWTLAVAPGVAASTGFVSLASNASNVSGSLAAWNTASLSGSFTLMLSAQDSFGNVAVATAAVYVGKPAIDLSIGKRASGVVVSTLKNPQGLVVRPDGKIWVAIDDNSRLLLVTSSGAVVATIGDGRANNDEHGNDHDKNDDNGRSARTVFFKHPRGLSLDAANNLYVADRDNDRVVKLSPDGSSLLLELNNGLKGPSDAVVDLDGSVYVADTGHRRVRVFSANGSVLRDIPTGTSNADSRPTGVALSSEGLWVSDQARKAVYLFTREGALLKTLSGMGRVRGASVDRVEALYVVDREDDRVRKFDPKGSLLLSFGSRDGADRGERDALKFLSDPSDAAIGPDGALWVADSGHDRIVRYALPQPSAGRGYGVAAVSQETVSTPGSGKAPASRTVDPQDGAKIERDDGTGVRVPAGALSEALELTVQSADADQDADAKRAKRLSHGVQPASEEIEYGPEGTQFAAPVAITLTYDPAAVALAGLKEDQLKVHYWNPTRGDWEALDSTVDKDAKTVSALTSHFSVYQVLGAGEGGIGVLAGADSTFALRAAYVFPNPVRGQQTATFRIQPGLADSVEVHVYDLSGRKIHSSSDFRSMGAYDDGNGLGAQYTYDHVWDISGVGSGVYTYIITAKKAGQSDIHKTGKVGVIK